MSLLLPLQCRYRKQVSESAAVHTAVPGCWMHSVLDEHPTVRAQFSAEPCSCLQVNYVRVLLRKRQLADVSVGTVDDFQGE
jgi:hypothetical protein